MVSHYSGSALEGIQARLIAGVAVSANLAAATKAIASIATPCVFVSPLSSIIIVVVDEDVAKL